MSANPTPKPIPRLGWIIAFLASATAITLAYTSLQKSRPVIVPDHLQPISEVPNFQLTDQTNSPVSLADLKGKIWIANFIFTRCPSPCPLISSRMAELNRKIERARKGVSLVTFTVDPTYDTPAVLAEYAEKLGADPTQWRFLTGPEAEIENLVVKGLLQPFEKEPSGLTAHSTRFVLVDAQGSLRGVQDGTDPEVVQKLLMDIGDLLRENPPK